MKRAVFSLNSQTKEDLTWEKVMENPLPVTLKRLVTGYMDCPISRLINVKDPKVQDIEKGTMSIPILAYLLEHPTFGQYLIDAGLDSTYQTRPLGRCKGLLAKKLFPKGRQERSQNLTAWIAPDKLKGVFLSHLHPDHIAGSEDLPPHLQYIVAKGERPFRIIPLLWDDYLRRVEVLYEIDMKMGVSIPPFESCVDVFGDGSFWMISTPGHTKNHVSFFINSLDRPAFLACDACHLKLCLERGVGPGLVVDAALAQNTLERIIDFSHRYPHVQLYAGHDS